MIKTITIIALCLLISASAFSQTGIGNLITEDWHSRFVVSRDTVDVIALVSDTSVEKLGVVSTYSIRCKAIMERHLGQGNTYFYSPLEYILPKRVIVWQSVIINK